MAKVLDWPELEEMSELLQLIQEIRESLAWAEDGNDFCMGLAEELKVDCST